MTSDNNMDDTDITGRDGYIIAEALHLAIKWIDAQPERRRSLSNQEDMQAILDAMWPELKEAFAFEDDLRLARQLGFKMPADGEPVTRTDLDEFLKSESDFGGTA